MLETLWLSLPPVALGLNDCWEISQCKQASQQPPGARAPSWQSETTEGFSRRLTTTRDDWCSLFVPFSVCVTHYSACNMIYSWADCVVILHAAHTDRVLAQEISLGERLEWHLDVYNWIRILTKQPALVIIKGLAFILSENHGSPYSF